MAFKRVYHQRCEQCHSRLFCRECGKAVDTFSLRNPGQVGKVYPSMAFNPDNERSWSTQKGRILQVMGRTHPRGWLAREMCYEVGISHNQANTRLGELRTAGLVMWNGVERETETRNMAHEFILTQRGFDVLVDHGFIPPKPTTKKYRIVRRRAA